MPIPAFSKRGYGALGDSWRFRVWPALGDRMGMKQPAWRRTGNALYPIQYQVPALHASLHVETTARTVLQQGCTGQVEVVDKKAGALLGHG